MDQVSEQSCNVSSRSKGFPFSILGAGGTHSTSFFHIGEQHPHSVVDSSSLIHRTHAFSYSPQTRKTLPPPPPAPAPAAPSQVAGDGEKTIRMTLVTADGQTPRRGRRRSSLFDSNVEPPKQMQVSVLSVASQGSRSFSKEREVRVSDHRSSRRYSAAQGSLEDMSQDTASFLHNTYTSALSHHDEEVQFSSKESSALNVYADSPSLPATAGVSAPVPIHGAIHRNPDAFYTSSDDLKPLSSISTIAQALPSVQNATESMGNARQTLPLVPNNDLDIESPALPQHSFENQSIGMSRSPGKVLSAIASNPAVLSSINSGLKNADGNTNQNLSVPARNHDLAQNSSKDNANLLEIVQQDKAVAPKSRQSGTPVIFRSSHIADVRPAERSAGIDAGPGLDTHRSGRGGDGLFSWVRKIGAWMGATGDTDQVDVSKKDLNVIAPSSF
ncbi:hypothetical protein EGW08_000629 [Elysia chlorotica]|uniref:Uncharacterized protein n=1 Tax=Elysia chlorotica TaxID=188477 RepID=A0A3S1BU48_ELYCH|nr:hypothetical protein EGW08_000629 [Elysia chlorotica]